MKAVPEGDVAPGVAPDVEAARLGEAVRVVVGGSEAHEDGEPAGMTVPPISVSSTVKRYVAFSTGPS